MKENIKMALKMVKVNIYELMAVFMKDNLIKIIYQVMEFIIELMVENIQDFG